MSLFERWYQADDRRSVVLVTHRMEDAAAYSDQIVVMDHGTVKLAGTPYEVFSQQELLTQSGLDVPETVRLLQKLAAASHEPIDALKFHLRETVDEIISFLGKES